MTYSRREAGRQGYRRLFTDQEVINLYEANSLENMARIASRRTGKQLSRETMRLWVKELADEGLVEIRTGGLVTPPPVSKQRLSSLYLRQKKGTTTITAILQAEGIDVDPTAVNKWLKQYGIPIRGRKEAAKVLQTKNIKPFTLSDAEILEKFNSGMSHEKLAAVLSTPERKVYPAGARRAVLRAQEALGASLRDKIQNTWSQDLGKLKPKGPIIAGAICTKCGAENSRTNGGYRIDTPTKGKNKGIVIERCAFRCDSCGLLWHKTAPAGWVATMKQSGAMPRAEGATL